MGWQEILDGIKFFSIVKFLDENCNEKLQQPIRGKNTQMIAYWYKPHIQRKGEKTKTTFCSSVRLGLSDALEEEKRI